MENIYFDVFYNQSAVHDYVVAFYAGYAMQDYAFADECLQYSTASLSQLYAFNQNMTRRYSWADPFFTVTYALGSPINDCWFYCYQWWTDFRDVYYTKYENFVDFGDLYLSFIFNLLGNSLQLRNKTKKMVTASDRHDMDLFYNALGATIRMTVDFNSYKTVGLAKDEFVVLAANKTQGF